MDKFGEGLNPFDENWECGVVFELCGEWDIEGISILVMEIDFDEVVIDGICVVDI